MNWYINTDRGVNALVDYFQFNQINYHPIVTWDSSLDTHGRHAVPVQAQVDNNSVLVIDAFTFFQMLEWPASKQQLIDFMGNNRIWVWNDMDGLLIVKHRYYGDLVADFDKQIPKGKLHYFIDGPMSDRAPANLLKNIVIKAFTYNYISKRILRITGSSLTKNPTAKDFLLTTVLKDGAPHRRILFNQLQQKSWLLDRGHIKFHFSQRSVFSDNYIGIKNSHVDCFPELPSMDLYRDSILEIVPETLYQGAYFVTEKTLKPIATQTPFLTIAPAHQLKYLRSMGFKTFDHVIDETYDQQYQVQDRIKLMLVTLEDIIKNGSQSFLDACTSELEHNQQRLHEIAGGWNYYMDLFIAQNIAEISG